MKPLRILIADDLPFNRTLLHHFMKKYGECEFAATGTEVVEKVRGRWEKGEGYDLILLDIMMPEMDGQQALAEIRNQEAAEGVPGREEVKVVMVTSLGDWDNVLQGFKRGVVEYIVKPVKEEQLHEVLGSMGFQPLANAGGK